ncbi:MAG TPA: exo-alpha-sialidase [Candidatus Hydrogenedentes bacterium]|nr:exo-alpha-sialidase [Candidatus Hydrogenedentota bacterium]
MQRYNLRNVFLEVLGLACFCAESSIAQTPDYQIIVETPYKELSNEFSWSHPYLAAIPPADHAGTPMVIMLAQKMLKNDAGDYYSGSYELRTGDLSMTWSGPTAVPELAWVKEDGYDMALSGMVPNWHPQTAKILAIGHCAMYDQTGTYIDRPGSQWVSYTVYDPQTGAWSRGQPLGQRGQDYFGTAASCDQWLIEPDGTVLAPVYVQPSQGARWAVAVWKCAFDGKSLSVVARGDLIARDRFRGMHEPSITKFRGLYWLTIRANDTAFVATSRDGLHFEPPIEWKFDDGQPLGSQNTQQHWITHHEGLFLAYTRKTGDNDDVFRNRAPLFIAQVDPDERVVLRSTERILLPNRGVPLGNFGVNHVTPYETWVSAGECMWPYHGKLPTDRGAEGAILVARIIWSNPNGDVP